MPKGRAQQVRTSDGRDALKICGVDPGLNRTGYAVVLVRSGGAELLDAGLIAPRQDASLAERLAELWREVGCLLDEHRPAVLVVEQLYSHYAHPRTAILMGHARGLVLAAAAQRQIEAFPFVAGPAAALRIED